MRRKLIISSAILGFLGVLSDQAAFQVDAYQSEIRDQREVLLQWASNRETLLTELAITTHRFEKKVIKNEIISVPMWDIIEYDINFVMNDLLISEEWVRHEDYEFFSNFNFSNLKETKLDINEIFKSQSKSAKDLDLLVQTMKSLLGGLLIERINLDSELFFNRQEEEKWELYRQTLILLAILSSLMSISSLLIIIRIK